MIPATAADRQKIKAAAAKRARLAINNGDLSKAHGHLASVTHTSVGVEKGFHDHREAARLGHTDVQMPRRRPRVAVFCAGVHAQGCLGRQPRIQAGGRRHHACGRGQRAQVDPRVVGRNDSQRRGAGAWVTMSTRWRRPCRHPETGVSNAGHAGPSAAECRHSRVRRNAGIRGFGGMPAFRGTPGTP